LCGDFYTCYKIKISLLNSYGAPLHQQLIGRKYFGCSAELATIIITITIEIKFDWKNFQRSLISFENTSNQTNERKYLENFQNKLLISVNRHGEGFEGYRAAEI